MHETLISHPQLRLEIRTGSEGPASDPYAFTEYHVDTPRGTTVLHEGLGSWLKHNGKNIAPPLTLSFEEQEHWLRFTAFKEYTGYDVAQLYRISRRLKSRCPNCGGREFTTTTGYPGEYFDLCTKCKQIVGSQFYPSEIE